MVPQNIQKASIPKAVHCPAKNMLAMVVVI
jgi:hypothetical protein